MHTMELYTRRFQNYISKLHDHFTGRNFPDIHHRIFPHIQNIIIHIPKAKRNRVCVVFILKKQTVNHTYRIMINIRTEIANIYM